MVSTKNAKGIDLRNEVGEQKEGGSFEPPLTITW
jgi:hypothetical protein